MDYHKQCLAALCRFCGGRVIKTLQPGHNRSFLASNYTEIVQAKFQIDLTLDLPDIHPTYLCTSCYCQLMNSGKWEPKDDWQEHKRNQECSSCNLFNVSTKPGRPKKRKHPGGRPPSASTPLTHLSRLYPSVSPSPKCQPLDNFPVPQSQSFLTCGVCSCVVWCPVETPCHHLFCVDCMSSLLSKVSFDCPVCRVNVHFSSLVKPPTYIDNLLHNLNLQCSHCHTTIHHTQISSHSCHIQYDHTYAKTNAMPELTEKQVQEVATAYIKEQLGSSDSAVATFGVPGRGQPITTVRVPNPQKSSTDCSAATVRKRSIVLNSLRSHISKNAEETQKKDELRDILGETGVKIPTTDILQLKSFFGLSWKKLRRLKRWLKERNIASGHEGGVRQLELNILGDNLVADEIPMQVSCEVTKSLEIKPAPIVQVKDLTALVYDLLVEYDRLEELTWHDGAIPKDELWIKIGGDKGGGTFKLMLQLANVGRPNSLSNTRVVLLFPGNDSTFNLNTTLSPFRQQVETLASASWRGKKVKLFVFGDYEYLTRIYGLTGPNGRHCCLYCNSTKQEMAIPPGSRPPTRPRTMETMKTSLAAFNIRGIAKEANNVVREPFFNIPIDRVCPPGLHMSLGIQLKHHNSLAASCHTLDMKIARHLASTERGEELASKFENQIRKSALQAQADELDAEVEELIEQHTMIALLSPDSNPPPVILEMAEEKKKEKTEVEKAISKLPDLPFGAGPISMALEKCLQDMSICRQAFHGGIFVGNHVHKYLQPQNVDAITDVITEAMEKHTNNEDLKKEAGVITGRYNQILQLYGACHRGINSGKFLTEASIDQLDKDIKSYMSFYRHNFPSESITPKQHLLEDHSIPWLRQWRASLGFLGEQGGEAVHCQLNNISRDLRGYSSELKRHLQSVKNQWIQSSPTNYHQHTLDHN